jgi:hypothetical protein
MFDFSSRWIEYGSGFKSLGLELRKGYGDLTGPM